MPILTKDFVWSQTPKEIHVTIPLKGVHPTKISDIFITEKFVKINYSPYYYEAFLEHSIDKSASVCKILENHIKFILKKTNEDENWTNLESPEASEKRGVEKRELKESILNENNSQVAIEYENKKKLKAEFKRKLIKMELKQDQMVREGIDGFHQRIKEQEEKEISKNLKIEKNNKTDKVETFCKTRKPIAAIKEKPQTSKVAVLPGVRQRGTIEVNFSERRFITPQRESQEVAEREWMLKQNEVKKSIGFSNDDLRPEERNPKWLLEKGNEFYKKGNYLAAISAYSTGIKIAKEPAILLLNRAVTHFALENYNRCAVDTSKAYELFVPAVPSNLAGRIKCLSLRGAALVKLGFLKQGRTELVAALELDPRNVALKDDLEMVESELRKVC